MSAQALSSQALVRQTVIEVALLPEPDLARVMEFVRRLKDERITAERQTSATEIRNEAERLASEMAHLSRDDVMLRFRDTLERIRTQAIANGTAIDGDWNGD